MIGKSHHLRGRLALWAAGAILLAGSWARAQTPPAKADPIPTTVPDSGIVQTGCAGCGGGSGLGSLCGPGELGSGACGSCCYPGRNFCCSDNDSHTKLGRLIDGFYHCLCCPDPCYDPCWLPVADTGFFVDAARPVTQMRLRWDNQFRITDADRAEYIFARYRTMPNQLGPGGPWAKIGFGKGPNTIISRTDISELSMYMEAAQGAFSAFIDTPYKHIDPETAPITFGANAIPAMAAVMSASPIAGTVIPAGAGPLPVDVVLGPGGAQVPAVLPGTAPTVIPGGTTLKAGTVLTAGTVIAPGATMTTPGRPAMSRPIGLPACAASGFGDLTIGTKSLLLDCSLMQITFQFKTFLPTANFITGLGTGHVSLEPSILFNICCSKKMYLQGQLAYWIPVGGDNLYQGNIFHTHFSLNRLLWCPCAGVQLVSAFEVGHYTILNGAFTDTKVLQPDPNTGMLSPVSRAARNDFVYAGPGLRLFICEKMDIGVGSQFALTSQHFAEQIVRAEMRFRY